MLVGVDTAGRVTGVRALSHKETAGLGDQIDIDRSDWVLAFDGTSLEAPPRAAWTIARDDGAFDQMTGASVTSRAAVKAVAQTLEYVETRHAVLFGEAQGAGENRE